MRLVVGLTPAEVGELVADFRARTRDGGIRDGGGDGRRDPR
ncbi:hypothetical protein ACFW9F_23460 [Streptomyces sp. NPDC059506]|nr:hypothetical protein [Streptomyces sp. HB2AG]MCZ2525022.1 hypothetical protein [Streptomyces sp. HB2AG]